VTWLANEITRRMELFVLEPSDVDREAQERDSELPAAEHHA